MTHRSYINEHPSAMEDNERLEFLGDACLDMTSASWLYQRFPELDEGGVERGVVEFSREMARRGIESIVISAGGRLVPRLESEGTKHVAMDVVSKNPLTAPRRAAGLVSSAGSCL